jgi:hypothetical protein
VVLGRGIDVYRVNVYNAGVEGNGNICNVRTCWLMQDLPCQVMQKHVLGTQLDRI